MCVRADITRDSQTGEETSRVLHVVVSHDGGRTWTAMKALGLPPIPSVDAPPPNQSGGGYVESEGTVPDEVIYSAGYAQDHTVYLSVYGQITGLYKTTDDGDTWTFSTPIVGNDIGGPFTAYADPRPGPAGASTLTGDPIALGNRTKPDRFDGPMTTSENGANPAWSLQFAYAARAYKGIQLVGVAEVEDPLAYFTDIASVRSCTLDLDCSRVLHTFPVNSALGPLVLAGDFGTTGRMFVEESTNDSHKGLGWLESTDGGRSFHGWSLAAKAARDVARVHGDRPDIAVVTNPLLPRVVVADVFYDTARGTYERDYVSRDDGRQWTASRPVLRAPANYEWVRRTVTLAPNGSLFVLAPVSPGGPSAAQQDVFTPKQAMWCSSDYGRTWGFACR